jgi:nitrite reductase/ring-hydroxylating ferredoxin subunit
MRKASGNSEDRAIASNRKENDREESDRKENDREKEVSRRCFNKFLTLGSLAAAAIAAGVLPDGCSKTFPARVIAQAGDIPVGGSKIFTYPTDIAPCILLRPAENTYLAFSRICTHTSCPVFYRPEQNRIDCPCHGGVYSAADGSVLAGPPPRPLPRITIEERGNDLVAIAVVRG